MIPSLCWTTLEEVDSGQEMAIHMVWNPLEIYAPPKYLWPRLPSEMWQRYYGYWVIMPAYEQNGIGEPTNLGKFITGMHLTLEDGRSGLWPWPEVVLPESVKDIPYLIAVIADVG